MTCAKCRHWNGTRVSEWGDCGHIVFVLTDMPHTDRFGDPCEPPLDPHDMRYYLSDSKIHKFLKGVAKSSPDSEGHLPDGIRTETVKENVMFMDDQQVESVRRLDIPYFQTQKDKWCNHYEDA